MKKVIFLLLCVGVYAAKGMEAVDSEIDDLKRVLQGQAVTLDGRLDELAEPGRPPSDGVSSGSGEGSDSVGRHEDLDKRLLDLNAILEDLPCLLEKGKADQPFVALDRADGGQPAVEATSTAPDNTAVPTPVPRADNGEPGKAPLRSRTKARQDNKPTSSPTNVAVPKSEVPNPTPRAAEVDADNDGVRKREWVQALQPRRAPSSPSGAGKGVQNSPPPVAKDDLKLAPVEPISPLQVTKPDVKWAFAHNPKFQLVMGVMTAAVFYYKCLRPRLRTRIAKMEKGRFKRILTLMTF